MGAIRGIGGVIGAVLWFLFSDAVGGVAGLAAGLMAWARLEPTLGLLAACAPLFLVAGGLYVGGLLGVASLGWLAGMGPLKPQPDGVLRFASPTSISGST